MSSPNHPTSKIEDAFSLNFLDFISATPNYVSTSPGKTYSSSSNSFGVVPIASPSLLLFQNDPNMKVLQAFYAKESPIPPPNPITPPVILTPSLVLPPSPLFDPQYFFVLEELLPPKKQIHHLSSSSTTLSNSSRKHAAVSLIRWFKRTESVFSRSNYAKKNKVKFVINTLTEEALFWWNSFAQPIGVKEAYKITWSEFKRLLIKKYYPQTEIKIMEEAITITQKLIEQVLKHNSVQETNNHKLKLEDRRNTTYGNNNNNYRNNNHSNDHHQ
nr:reverse transcriptase domain-containing protein [Tanacetum cinerariifolium]